MKKETGNKVWNFMKDAISVGVGVGTGVVTTAICTAYAPGEAASMAVKVAFKAGTYGLSTVTGAVAKDLARQEIEELERGIRLNILARNQEKKTESAA